MLMSSSTALPSSLGTGHAGIDQDHEELLALCQSLPQTLDDELPAAFHALHARFAAHFAQEDALMAQQDFSSRQCHLDEHAAVLQSFEDVGVALREGRMDPARRMGTALIDWLPEHIDALDRHLAKFMFYQQTGGAPVLIRRPGHA
jgi:hemerythrin